MERFGRETREYMTRELKSVLEGSPDIFVTAFSNLKAPELEKLRLSLKKVSSRYLVIKNTIAQRVIKEKKIDGISEMISGTCGMVVIGDDAIAASRALAEFKKEHETLDIRGGILDGSLISSERIDQLSKLPSREVLLSILASTLYSPVTGFVNVLSGIIRKFGYALNGIKEKREGETNSLSPEGRGQGEGLG